MPLFLQSGMASCAKSPRARLQDALTSASDRMQAVIKDKLDHGTDDELKCLCSILFVGEHDDKSNFKKKLSIMKSSPFTDKEMRQFYARAVWRGDIDSMRLLCDTLGENEEISHMERVLRASLRILRQTVQRGASLSEKEAKAQTKIHEAFQSTPDVSAHASLFHELIQLFGEAAIVEMDRTPLPQWRPASEMKMDWSGTIRVRTNYPSDRPSTDEIRIKVSRETLFAFGKSTSTNYVSWLGASAYIERVLKWCLIRNQMLVLSAGPDEAPKALAFPLGDLDHDNQPLFGVVVGKSTEVMAFQFGAAKKQHTSLVLRPADLFKGEALPDVDVSTLSVPRMHAIAQSMMERGQPGGDAIASCVNACWFNPGLDIVLGSHSSSYCSSARLAQSRPWSVSPCLPETGFRENGPLDAAAHPLFLIPVFSPLDGERAKLSNVPVGALVIRYDAEKQCYIETEPGVVTNLRNAFLMAKLLTRCPPKWVYTGVYQELRDQEDTSSG